MAETRTVLLIEGNEEETMLAQRSFEGTQLGNVLRGARSAAEARAYLEGEGEYKDRDQHPLPEFILLDLGKLGEDGFGFLRWLRGHRRLHSLPVVVFTRTREKRDVDRAYGLGANSVVLKPDDPQELMDVSRELQQYWIEFSCPPAPVRSAGPRG